MALFLQPFLVFRAAREAFPRPQWEVTCVDVSAEMSELSRSLLVHQGGHPDAVLNAKEDGERLKREASHFFKMQVPLAKDVSSY